MLHVDIVTEENYFITMAFKQPGYHIFHAMALLYWTLKSDFNVLLNVLPFLSLQGFRMCKAVIYFPAVLASSVSSNCSAIIIDH